MSSYIPTKLSLAEAAETEMLGCSFSQWHRLKSRVTALGTPRGSHETWATFFYGVAAAAVLALVAETASEKREGWMQVVYIVVAVVCALAGIVVRSLASDVNKRRVQDAADIVAEMDLVEESWIRSTFQPTASPFSVFRATYGTAEVFVDVTGILSGLIKNGRLDFTVNNETMRGDPVPNQRKLLTVYWISGGETLSSSFEEGVHVTLPD